MPNRSRQFIWKIDFEKEKLVEVHDIIKSEQAVCRSYSENPHFWVSRLHLTKDLMLILPLLWDYFSNIFNGTYILQIIICI